MLSEFCSWSPCSCAIWRRLWHWLSTLILANIKWPLPWNCSDFVSLLAKIPRIGSWAKAVLISLGKKMIHAGTPSSLQLEMAFHLPYLDTIWSWHRPMSIACWQIVHGCTAKCFQTLPFNVINPIFFLSLGCCRSKMWVASLIYIVWLPRASKTVSSKACILISSDKAVDRSSNLLPFQLLQVGSKDGLA